MTELREGIKKGGVNKPPTTPRPPAPEGMFSMDEQYQRQKAYNKGYAKGRFESYREGYRDGLMDGFMEMERKAQIQYRKAERRKS